MDVAGGGFWAPQPPRLGRGGVRPTEESRVGLGAARRKTQPRNMGGGDDGASGVPGFGRSVEQGAGPGVGSRGEAEDRVQSRPGEVG